MRKDQIDTIATMNATELRSHAREVESNLVRLQRLCKVRAMINEERGGGSVHAANVYLLVADCLENPERIVSEIEKSVRLLTK